MKQALAILLAILVFLGAFAVAAAATNQTEDLYTRAIAIDDETDDEIDDESPGGAPKIPWAPNGLSQQIMKLLLFLPSLFDPGWADEAVTYLAFFSWLVPPPFNWLLIWFIRAV